MLAKQPLLAVSTVIARCHRREIFLLSCRASRMKRHARNCNVEGIQPL